MRENFTENNNKSVQGKKNTNMLVAAFIMFVFPIIAIFLGVFIGECIGKAVNVSILTSQIVGGIMGFILAGVVIKLFDKFSKSDEKIEKIHWDDL